VTSRDCHGGEGCPVVIVAGTKAEVIIEASNHISEEVRETVEEIALDLPDSMRKTVRCSFPRALRVTDRFHIQKLGCDAVREIRIKHRWDAIQEDNDKREEVTGERYEPVRYDNGNTKKELLAGSRYLLFKPGEKWTPSQRKRVEILFKEYPDLKKAYGLSHALRMIFVKNTIKDAARLSMAKWYNRVEEAGFHSFNVIAATFYEHYDDILNFYNNCSSNAAAESFNAKIKVFRTALRGVIDVKFFLFRFAMIYTYPH
jgi:transposase